MGDTILSTVRKAARLAVYEEMMIKVKNHQTPPTMRPDRDLQAKGKRCQKHRHQLQKLWGRAKGQPKPCQQSCQTLLHPSPRSARCENSYVRDILLGILFLIADKDLCGCYSSGVIKPYRHIFIPLSHIHTHQYTCQQRQICQHLSTK